MKFRTRKIMTFLIETKLELKLIRVRLKTSHFVVPLLLPSLSLEIPRGGGKIDDGRGPAWDDVSTRTHTLKAQIQAEREDRNTRDSKEERRAEATLLSVSLFETVSVSSFLIRLSLSLSLPLWTSFFLTVFSFSIYRHHHQEQFFTSSSLFYPIFSNLHTMKQETGIITWSSNYKWERGRGTSWWDWSSFPIHSSLAPSFLPLINSLLSHEFFPSKSTPFVSFHSFCSSINLWTVK